MLSTRRDPVVERLHGVEVADPYRWLEDGDDPEVRAWVAEQNAATRSVLDVRGDRSHWSDRLTELMALPVVLGVQVRAGTVVVLERPEGAPQARLTATRPDPSATPDPSPDPSGTSGDVVIVDPAAAADDAAVAVDWFELSADGTLVAYGLSEGGTEDSVLRVARTADGSHLDEAIPHTRACSVAWEPDGSGFFYTRYPEGDEYHRTVHHHRLGDPSADDPVVWAEHPTPQTWPSVESSPDGRYVLVTAMESWSRDDVHLLDRSSGEWHDVVRGADGRTGFTFAADSSSILGVTTIDAPNGRVVSVPLGEGVPGEWAELVAERDDVVLGAARVAGDRLLLAVTRRATDALEWWVPSGDEAPVPVDPALFEPVPVDLGPVSIDSSSVDPLDGAAYVVTSGFTAPGALHSVGPDGAVTSVRGGGGAPPDLLVDEVTYTSTDGVAVGMFLVTSATAGTGDGPRPTVLTGYGGFSITMSPAWSPTIAAWCEAGGAYAIPGLRGGSEHGEAWHRAGKREHKQQVFDDFAAAADWLVATGRTTRDRLAIAGGSNGGLLVGAALTQRPELCRAVWCAVPLLDMVRFPQFLIARLWIEEYGDPDVAAEFGWLHGYSPYHRVVDDTCYPAVLLTTAEGDTRVDPLHARKMAARLQAASSCLDDRPVLLHQEGRAGHGQGKPVAKRVAEQTDVLSFFAWQLRVAP